MQYNVIFDIKCISANGTFLYYCKICFFLIYECYQNRIPNIFVTCKSICIYTIRIRRLGFTRSLNRGVGGRLVAVRPRTPLKIWSCIPVVPCILYKASSWKVSWFPIGNLKIVAIQPVSQLTDYYSPLRHRGLKRIKPGKVRWDDAQHIFRKRSEV